MPFCNSKNEKKKFTLLLNVNYTPPNTQTNISWILIINLIGINIPKSNSMEIVSKG